MIKTFALVMLAVGLALVVAAVTSTLRDPAHNTERPVGCDIKDYYGVTNVQKYAECLQVVGCKLTADEYQVWKRCQ